MMFCGVNNHLNEWVVWVWSYCNMVSIRGQRICVKFRTELGKTAMKTHIILRQAYSTEGLSRTITYKWHFQSRRTSYDDDEWWGQL
jgi:hypothetical protein